MSDDTFRLPCAVGESTGPYADFIEREFGGDGV